MNRKSIVGLILVIAFALKINNKIDITYATLILLSLVFIGLTYKTNNLEFMTSDEAIAQIVSILDSGNMKITNLEVTGDLKVGNNINGNNINGNNMKYSGYPVMRQGVDYPFKIAGMAGGYYNGESPGYGGRYVVVGGGKYVAPAYINFL